MDTKVVLKFVADVLYVKGVVCLEEYDAILESSSFSDLDVIIEKMLSSEFNTKTRKIKIDDLN